MKPRLFVILGPTASGKSALAIKLAKKFNGEVVSADSRQVYRGLDIGTGKVPRDPTNDPEPRTHDYLHAGVLHHLLDVAEPQSYFSVVDFKTLADKTIADIARRDKLPILVGGTGQYIQAIVDNVVPPEVPPDETLRRELAGKSADELFSELKRLDPVRAKTIEQDNPRRLIRAIEIAQALGSVPKTDISFPADYSRSPYNTLQIGLNVPIETLTERIRERVQERLKHGWADEVQELLAAGVAPERLAEFGLGYRIITHFLNGKIYSTILQNCGIDPAEKEKMVDTITAAECRYAKRQVRWFKRDQRIRWFKPEEISNIPNTVQAFFQT
jgi:tRNA dimethylallyltransferase